MDFDPIKFVWKLLTPNSIEITKILWNECTRINSQKFGGSRIYHKVENKVKYNSLRIFWINYWIIIIRMPIETYGILCNWNIDSKRKHCCWLVFFFFWIAVTYVIDILFPYIPTDTGIDLVGHRNPHSYIHDDIQLKIQNQFIVSLTHFCHYW